MCIIFRLDDNFDITAAIGLFMVHGHYTRSALYQECNNYIYRAIYTTSYQCFSSRYIKSVRCFVLSIISKLQNLSHFRVLYIQFRSEM